MPAFESLARPARRPELAGVVELLWYVSAPGRSGHEIALPAPEAQLIINLADDRLTAAPVGAGPPGAVGCGSTGIAPITPHAVLLDRSEQRRIAGVVLRAEAVGAVVGGGSSDLGLLTGLDDLLGPAAHRLGDAARSGRDAADVLDRIETALVALLRDRPSPCPTTGRAIALLRGGTPVATVADEVGLSTSTLTRRFRSAVGVRPKQFHRLLRLRRALRSAATTPDATWADIAAGSGYYDQAHLIHDFGELTGLTPLQWRRWGDGSLHVPIPDPAPAPIARVTISSKSPAPGGDVLSP